MSEYKDVHNFEPLSPAYNDLLLHICDMAKQKERSNELISLEYDYFSAARELKERGYLSVVEASSDHAYVGLSFVGERYPKNREEWESRYKEWRKEKETERKEDKRHNWKITVFSVLGSAVGVVIGVVVGFFLGRI